MLLWMGMKLRKMKTRLFSKCSKSMWKVKGRSVYRLQLNFIAKLVQIIEDMNSVI